VLLKGRLIVLIYVINPHNQAVMVKISKDEDKYREISEKLGRIREH
jgi:hypothetical protein